MRHRRRAHFRFRLRRRLGRMTQLDLPFSGRTVTDVLGETRNIKQLWPDGGYTCPFCGSAAEASGCRNPACSAGEWALSHPEATRSRFEEARRRAEEQKKYEAERANIRRFQEEYAEESRRERETQINAIAHEAKMKGACVRCALKDAPYRVKFVRHRGVCPLERR